MRRNIFLLLFLAIQISISVFAKGKPDIGVIAGATNYMGDLNNSGIIQSPGYTFGLNFRYNYNPRYVFKISAHWLNLSGQASPYNDISKLLPSQSFVSNMVELTPQFEINFLSLKYNEKKTIFSPYVSFGIGSMIQVAGTNAAKPMFNIPFTFGNRFFLSKIYTLGLEWNIRKIFSDQIDGFSNIGDQKNLFHNNDWFYFVALNFSVRLFTNKVDCPAYN